MEYQLFLIILNFISLFLITFFYYKRTGISVGSYILSLYTVSAFASIIYFLNPFFSLEKEITLFPFLYWIISFTIICAPVFKFDNYNIKGIKYDIRIIHFICILGLFISLIPFYEQIVQIPTIFNGNTLSDTISDIHDADDKGIVFSPIGKFLQRIVWSLYDLIFLCILPVLREKRKQKLALIGIIMIIITRNLEFLVLASRGNLLKMGLQLILVLIILYPLMTLKEKRNIFRIVLILSLMVFIVFVTITIARQTGYSENNEEYTMLYFLSRYTGEGMINFNQYVFTTKNITDGDFTFWTFKNLLGYDMQLIDRVALYGHYHYITGIPLMIFFTFIGFFVIDIGPINTILLFSLISLLISNLVKTNKSRNIPLSNLFIIYIFANTIVNGTCVYHLMGKSSEYILLYITIFLLLKWKKM